MGKFAKGIYNIKNKEKYIGKRSPIYRSSWESTFMMFCDNHPAVLQWASEPFSISYHDPITNKQKNYWPDFFMIYLDAAGIKHAEIIEIKPSTQSGQKKTKSRVNNAQIIRNHAKWNSCLAFCGKNGLQFRVLTEKEIFKTGLK